MTMFLVIILLLLTKISHTTSGNAGSILFKNRRAIAQCWNSDDIVRLRARKSFEDLLPAQVHPDNVNGWYTSNMLRYLRKTLHSVEKHNDTHISKLLQEAIADTIGAHLRYDILPTTRFAFYAGYVPYRNVRQIHDFYEEVKRLLNTQGLGWKRPARTPLWSNLTVAKILIGAGTFFDPCSSLVIKRDANLCIHLPIPRLDDKDHPAAIALPFKTDGLISLTSPNSNDILLKYYTIAARCILSSSPTKCRHTDFLSFNNDLWNWMKRDVAPHLMDEKLYPAYGGVLRIAAAVQTYGKGLSRRNLFEYQDANLARWHPWKSLAQSYVYVNTDWSPKLYVGVVVAVAVAIYLIQICYNYLCGSNCPCKGHSKVSFFSKDVAYADVESNIPAMLPIQREQSTCYNESHSKLTLSKTKSASLGSVRTQKVFDLNDNTEKLMPIMSGNEYSESSSSEINECENKKDLDNNGPPKIDISISQVNLRRLNKKSRSPMYSTSTATHDTYEIDTHTRESDSASTGSYTSESGSSTTSESCVSRQSRDLAWAKRVISKHSVRSTQSTSRTDIIDQHTAVRSSSKSLTSRTELDLTSFTTPPSHQ